MEITYLGYLELRAMYKAEIALHPSQSSRTEQQKTHVRVLKRKIEKLTEIIDNHPDRPRTIDMFEGSPL